MKKYRYTFVMILMLSALQYSIAQVIEVPEDYPTIQQGIDAASDGDTVLVAEGTYVENVDFKEKHLTLASHFILDRNTDHIANTIIDGSKPSDPKKGAVVSMEGNVDTTAVLTGFSITGGTGNKAKLFTSDIYAGGGVCCRGAKIEYNYIYENHIADHTDLMAMGGGIAQLPPEVSGINIIVRMNRIYNNTITSETFSQGAGVAIGSDDGLTLAEYNDIYNNISECQGSWKANAGGLLVGVMSPWEGELIVRNNRIVDNEIKGKRGQGAGIFVTITRNSHEYQDAKPIMEFYNNIIAYNTSSDAAGGMAFWDQMRYPWKTPAMFISNNTFYKNRADKVPGIYNYNGLLLLMNNIIWEDLSGNNPDTEELSCERLYLLHGGKNNGKFICIKNVIQNSANPNNSSDEPSFEDEQSYRLTNDSPGIDFGMKAYVVNGHSFVAPGYDFYGVERPHGSVDAGAAQTSAITSDLRGAIVPGGEKIRMFPNPFTDHLTIDIGSAGEVKSVALYNLRGQLKRHIEYPKKAQLIIHRDALPPGMYFLRVEGEGVYTGKVIAQ